MTTKTPERNKAEALLTMLFPMLESASENAVKALSLSVFPRTEAWESDAQSLNSEGFNDMRAELFSIHMHEQAHAALMRQFDPECNPKVKINARPEIHDRGVAMSIREGTCTSKRGFHDPFERACISVAGWVMDHIGTLDLYREKVADEHTEEDAGSFILTKNSEMLKKPEILAALWLSPQFGETFKGCGGDLEHLRAAVRANVLRVLEVSPDADEDDMEEAIEQAGTDPEVRAKVLNATTEFLRNVFKTTTRVIDRERYNILDRAITDAHAMTEVFMEQTKIVGECYDRIRGAGLGLLTPEAIDAALTNGELQRDKPGKPAKVRTKLKPGVNAWNGKTA